MNRRNFFQLLGAAAPLLFLPKVIDPVRWKVLGPSGILVPNPAWINAPLEYICAGPWVFGSVGPRSEGYGYWSVDLIEHPRYEVPDDPKKKYPVRYALIDPVTFQPVPIDPFIRK